MRVFKPACIATLLTVGVGLPIGCSGRPARVHPPTYNAQAGAEAIAAYDANGDGAIADEEFDSVGALRAALKQIDTDGDGRVTAAEIDARVQAWQSTKVAEMPVLCEVTIDGKPLAGAQVTFEPEPFLGDILKPAGGTTEANGNASISLADEHLADPRYPGVACGWYKIRVTSSEREIPAKYNTQTTLGCEVAINAHWVNHGTVVVKLTSS